MKLPPRTAHALALASLFALACPGTPRVDAARLEQQQKKRTDAAKKRGPNARERRTREQAVAALVEAAEAVRLSDDLYEGVRLRAEIAEVLWPHDAASARAMLGRAWEAATAPGAEDRVAGFEEHEDPRGEARRALERARRSVVKAALKHDPRLAEEFMRQSARGPSGGPDAPPEAGEADAAPSSSSGAARTLSRAGQQRLLLADELVGDGEHALAAAAAAPLAAEGPTVPFLDFILRLRAHAPREADALYLRLLEHTRADASANANDVLLLSTPVVSPTLHARVGADGSVGFRAVALHGAGGGEAATTLPAEVRRAFFNVAASVLTRPRAAAGGDAAQRADEAARLYFAAARLLPAFEREAAHHAPALHALVAALAAEIEARRRQLLDTQAGVSSVKPSNPTDPLAPLLKSVGEASGSPEGDRRRFDAVRVAAGRRMWDRARIVAAEIGDEETRRNARRLIATEQVMGTLRAFGDDAEGKQDAAAEDAERAAEFVRAADVPPEVRAAGLAQAAELAARRGMRARAEALLAEAASHAEQAGRDDDHRAHAFALVTLAAARTGSARTWELLAALARAVNETEGYALAPLSFRYEFRHLGAAVEHWASQGADDSQDLRHVYAAAARLDPARALAEARALADNVVRANVLAAAARAALEKTTGGGAK